MTTDSDRPQPIQTVYEQYWKHARHVEEEMWSFTRIWALILTAIFTILGTDLPTGAKVSAALFGALLSMLGFFIVYTLRIPFLDFFLTTEIIAKNEFELSDEYRRLGTHSDFRINKRFDIPDVLVAIYLIVASIMISSAGIIAGQTILGIGLGILMGLTLFVIYIKYIIPDCELVIESLIDNLRD